MTADGNTVVVRGPGDVFSVGAMWVFTRTAGVWTQHGNELVGTGPTGDARQGHSVAVSADGTTAIMGGQNDNSNTGAAWVFFGTTPVGVPPGPGSGGIVVLSLVLLANPTRVPIRFALSAAADQSERASVQVLDVSGRMVKSMDIGRVMQGTTSLSWDGRDDGGKRVSAGTYLLRLESAGRSYGSVKATVLR